MQSQRCAFMAPGGAVTDEEIGDPFAWERAGGQRGRAGQCGQVAWFGKEDGA